MFHSLLYYFFYTVLVTKSQIKRYFDAKKIQTNVFHDLFTPLVILVTIVHIGQLCI